MLSPRERKDKIVKSTDIDALSCRQSANSKRYFDPPDPFVEALVSSYKKYLRYVPGYTNLSAGRVLRTSFNDNKLPIINLGTYLRTRLIDCIIDRLVQEFEDIQIVSLGSGSDTRAFRLLKKYPHRDIRYIELDFEDSCRIKKLAILDNEDMRQLAECSLPTIDVLSASDFQQIDSGYTGSRYKLIGMDIRLLGQINAKERQICRDALDMSRPTIILSECVLCYLSEGESTRVIDFFVSAFTSKSYFSFLIYEPLSLNDTFGETMSANLAARGINLMTFQQHTTLESKVLFLVQNCGFDSAYATDIATVGNYGENPASHQWLDEAESKRIRQVEWIDEVEEIILLYKHYCVYYGELSSDNIFLLETFPWLCRRTK